MPPAIAAIGAAWTAIGSLGIVGGMIQGAIIGAAIGGISSAVMGGDIGKGILFGAVGGAVMGGITSAFEGASMLSSASSSTGKVSAASMAKNPGFGGGAKVIEETTRNVSGGGLMGFLETKAGSTLGEGAMKLVGGMLQGADAEAMAKDERAFTAAEAEKNRQFQEKMAKLQLSASGGGGSNDGIAIARIQQETALKQLGEQRRQYDVARQDVMEKAKKSSDTLKQVKVGRRAYQLAGVDSLETGATKDFQERTGMLQEQDMLSVEPQEELQEAVA